MLMLGKDQSFSLTANVTSPGYQTIALKGYLVDRRPDGTYIAPLIPQLFYGADGSQLGTWRQYLSQPGSQVILSRAAGNLPYVPPQELWWRKVSDMEERAVQEAEEKPWQEQLADWWKGLGLAGQALVVFVAGAAIIIPVTVYAAARI